MHQINRERALTQPDERLDRQQATHDALRILHADDEESGDEGKQQKAAAPQEDYGDELTDYDEPDGYGDEDDDGPPWDEEDDDGEEADK